MKMTKVLAACAAATALAFVAVACSNSSSSDSDGSGSSSSASSSIGSGTDFAGSITVGSAKYSMISFDSGSYTLAGTSGEDKGTYTSGKSARAGISAGAYTFTSTTTGGLTFTATLNGNTLTFGGGASGTASDLTGVTVTDLPASSGSNPFSGNIFYKGYVLSSGTVDTDEEEPYKFSSNTISVVDSDYNEYAFETFVYSYSGGTLSMQKTKQYGETAQEYIKDMISKNKSMRNILYTKNRFEMIRRYTVIDLGSGTYEFTEAFPDKLSNMEGSSFYNSDTTGSYSSAQIYSDTIYLNNYTGDDSANLSCLILSDNGSNLELAIIEYPKVDGDYSNESSETIAGYASATYELSSSSNTCKLTITALSAGFSDTLKTTYTTTFQPHSWVLVKQ